MFVTSNHTTVPDFHKKNPVVLAKNWHFLFRRADSSDQYFYNKNDDFKKETSQKGRPSNLKKLILTSDLIL